MGLRKRIGSFACKGLPGDGVVWSSRDWTIIELYKALTLCVGGGGRAIAHVSGGVYGGEAVLEIYI